MDSSIKFILELTELANVVIRLREECDTLQKKVDEQARDLEEKSIQLARLTRTNSDLLDKLEQPLKTNAVHGAPWCICGLLPNPGKPVLLKGGVLVDELGCETANDVCLACWEDEPGIEKRGWYVKDTCYYYIQVISPEFWCYVEDLA